ncbi:MAG: hypothetical protein KC419_07310, partial [Anaerolineales bacterium]|nr:hypothetical protein [Anaerolineales bacterium]
MIVNIEQSAPTVAPKRKPVPRHWGEWVIENLIQLAGVSTLIIIGLIFIFLLREGLPAFFEISPATLLGVRWYPIEEMYGLLPLL